jgi:hypothetical protein
MVDSPNHTPERTRMLFDSVKQKTTKILTIFTIFCALPAVFFTGVLPVRFQQPTPAPQSPEPASVSEGYEIYLPVISRLVNTDLTINTLEITQAVQTATNSVPLVAGRATVLRIYPQTNTAGPIPGVSVAVSATRNGSPLAGSPVIAGPASVVVSPSRSDINSSFNVRLPSDWLSGVVTLQTTIDPANTIEEKDDTNNSSTTTLTFNTVPDLNVTVIPINHIIDVQYTGPSQYSYIDAMLLKTYPVKAVHITHHINYNFDGTLIDLSGWNALLDDVLNLHYAEHAPSNQFYYGLIPVETSNGHTWLMYGSGFQGNGEVGGRGAIGLASSSNYHIDGGVLAAHEIGHNLARLHSPCGVTTGIDRSYPYSGGAIGQYGLDVTDLTQFKLYPNTTKDVMSYCQPAWVSDHTYQGMYNYLVGNSYRSVDQSQVMNDGLFIRIRAGEKGGYQLEPVYALDGTPEQLQNGSEFQVEFLDEAGNVVGKSPLPAPDTSDPPTSNRLITTLVEKPHSPFAALRIVKNGVSQIERSMPQIPASPESTLTIVHLDTGAMLRWGSPGVPAIVRFTTDQGSTWTALAVDWLGGEFFFDPASLPVGSIQFEIIQADHTAATLSTTWENQHP